MAKYHVYIPEIWMRIHEVEAADEDEAMSKAYDEGSDGAITGPEYSHTVKDRHQWDWQVVENV